MSSTTSPPPKITRSFSDFMRNASVEEKAELFGYVMDRVAERQQAVIDKARAMQAEIRRQELSRNAVNNQNI